MLLGFSSDKFDTWWTRAPHSSSDSGLQPRRAAGHENGVSWADQDRKESRQWIMLTDLMPLASQEGKGWNGGQGTLQGIMGSQLEKLEAWVPTRLWYAMNTDAFSENSSQQGTFFSLCLICKESIKTQSLRLGR